MCMTVIGINKIPASNIMFSCYVLNQILYYLILFKGTA